MYSLTIHKCIVEWFFQYIHRIVSSSSQSNLGHFYHPQKTPYPLQSHPIFPNPLSPTQPLFFSMDLIILNISYKWFIYFVTCINTQFFYLPNILFYEFTILYLSTCQLMDFQVIPLIFVLTELWILPAIMGLHSAGNLAGAPQFSSMPLSPRCVSLSMTAVSPTGQPGLPYPWRLRSKRGKTVDATSQSQATPTYFLPHSTGQRSDNVRFREEKQAALFDGRDDMCVSMGKECIWVTYLDSSYHTHIYQSF